MSEEYINIRVAIRSQHIPVPRTKVIRTLNTENLSPHNFTNLPNENIRTGADYNVSTLTYPYKTRLVGGEVPEVNQRGVSLDLIVYYRGEYSVLQDPDHSFTINLGNGVMSK